MTKEKRMLTLANKHIQTDTQVSAEFSTTPGRGRNSNVGDEYLPCTRARCQARTRREPAVVAGENARSSVLIEIVGMSPSGLLRGDHASLFGGQTGHRGNLNSLS